ncbi:MAG: PAS domain S-box protein [Blastocatellia bacterium]|nr:PAS domain S-box protein [Blastocatellia bacterium]
MSIALTALAILRQFMFVRENTRGRAKLTELQERIEGICSASADGIAVADFDGNLLEVNDAFIKLMGYELEELTSGFKALDLFSSHDREATLEVNKRVMTEQAAVDYEKEYVRKDGTVFTAHVTAFPVRSRQGAPAAIAAIVRDITGRKRSETMLREAEERWLLALRVNRDGVWDWDLRNKTFFFSPRWREMFGYSESEELHFTMATLENLFHPDDRHLARETRIALMDVESPYIDVEFRHKCKDDSYRWIRCRAESVINKATGRLERVIGLHTDISDKKQRELESEALGQILRGVTETANLDELLSLVHVAIGSVVHARNYFVALHDEDTDLFTMQFFVDEHDERPDSANLEGTRSDYVYRTGRALLLDEKKTAELEAEGKFRLVGAQPKYWLGVPLKTPNKIIGVLVVQSYDIEHSYSDDNLQFLNNVAGPIALSIERKRAESRTLLLNAALDAAANGILITDGSGSIEWSNRAFTTLTGYTADEVKGKNSQILESGKHDDEFYADMWRTITAGNPWMGELTNRRKSGELYEEEMTITPVFDEASGTNHFISIKSDITERKLAEEQLRIFNHKLQLSNRELQDFAFVASHDLQEPLRKVQTFADRLSTKYSGALDETGLDYLERMRNAAGRMQTLIQDLLSFSRVTTQAQPFMPVNVEEITKGVLSDLEVKIEETGATVEMRGLPVIDADPSQIRQLVQNLVGNALKFRRDGVAPIVKISAEPRENGNGGAYEITVEDNGIGFDEKYLDKIFTVFQRLHGRAEYEGSGIGLAVCRKIVERHNGTITAISAPGSGAKFKFTLPTHQSNAELN